MAASFKESFATKDGDVKVGVEITEQILDGAVMEVSFYSFLSLFVAHMALRCMICSFRKMSVSFRVVLIRIQSSGSGSKNPV